MLWKPVAPVYPRLVKKVPDGLTPDEATEMRMRGRQLPPICKLGKANFPFSELRLRIYFPFSEKWRFELF